MGNTDAGAAVELGAVPVMDTWRNPYTGEDVKVVHEPDLLDGCRQYAPKFHEAPTEDDGRSRSNSGNYARTRKPAGEARRGDRSGSRTAEMIRPAVPSVSRTP